MRLFCAPVFSLVIGCTYSYHYTVVERSEAEGTFLAQDGVTAYSCDTVNLNYLTKSEDHLRLHFDCPDTFETKLEIAIQRPISAEVSEHQAEFKVREDGMTSPAIAGPISLALSVFTINSRFNSDEDTAEFGPVEALSMQGDLQADFSAMGWDFSVDVSVAYEERLETATSHYD